MYRMGLWHGAVYLITLEHMESEFNAIPLDLLGESCCLLAEEHAADRIEGANGAEGS